MSLPSPVRGFLKSRMSQGLREAIRNVAGEYRIQRIHRASARRAAALVDRPAPVCVNLGCGYHPKPGWINVDLFAPAADLHLDLREPFPFPSRSIDRIYTEHFFEHLNLPNLHESMGWNFEGSGTPSEAMTFLRESCRVLKPLGTIDIIVPDAEGMIHEYVEHQPELPNGDYWGPKWCDTMMHRLNYLFRQGREHKYAYDEQTLAQVLVAAGFTAPQRRPFDPSLEQANHEIGSLCMTAVKPAADVVSTLHANQRV
jgi:predicted SAM-dependent methyltransferase